MVLVEAQSLSEQNEPLGLVLFNSLSADRQNEMFDRSIQRLVHFNPYDDPCV